MSYQQYPPPPPPPGQGYYPPPAPPQTNGKSIVALVLGILAIVVPYVGFVLGIIAIVFAKLSFTEIRQRGEQGRGLAVAGLVCGIIGTALYAIIIAILVIAFIAVAGASSYSTF